MRLSDVRQSGFTLVELMIVVAIIGLLAVISLGSYHKYTNKARASEVYAMLGEFRAKEEAYRAENSVYCSTVATAAASCASGSENTVFPALLAAGEPVAKSVSGAAWGWTTGLGINPGKSQLYCGYTVVAGGPNATDWGNAGTNGSAMFASTQPTTAWWYATAICDNDGNASVNARFTTTMNTTSVVVANEGR